MMRIKQCHHYIGQAEEWAPEWPVKCISLEQAVAIEITLAI